MLAATALSLLSIHVVGPPPDYPFVPEIAVEAGGFVPDLADVVFHGSGTPLGATAPRDVVVSGRQIGADHPTAFAFHLRALLQVHAHLLVGFTLGLFEGALDDAHHAARLSLGLDDGFGGFDGGAIVGTQWSVSAFDLRGSAVVGGRSVGVGLVGFQPVTCSASSGNPRVPSGGSFPCAPSALAASAFVQLRLDAGVRLGALAELSLYGALDLAGAFDGVGVTGGVSLAIHAERFGGPLPARAVVDDMAADFAD